MRDSMLGVVLDAMNPASRPTPARLARFGADCVRLLASTETQYRQYDARVAKAGFERFEVFTSAAYGSDLTSQTLARTTREIVAGLAPGFSGVIANEWDTDGAARWPLGGEDAFVYVYNIVSSAILNLRPTTPLWIGGLLDCANALSTLRRVIPRLTIPPVGVDLHPYYLSAEEIDSLVVSIREWYPQLKIGILEWNESKTKNIKPFVDFLRASVDVSMFLPWPSFAGIDLPGLTSPKTGSYTALGRAYGSAIEEMMS